MRDTYLYVNLHLWVCVRDGTRILGEHSTTELPSLHVHKNSVKRGARQFCLWLITDAHFCPLLTFVPDVGESSVNPRAASSHASPHLHPPPQPSCCWGVFLAQPLVLPWRRLCSQALRLSTVPGTSQSPAGGGFLTSPSALPQCRHL